MHDRKLLDEAWADFARAVLPPGCPDVQRQEMRRAFYGGGYTVLMFLIAVIGDASVSEEQGIGMLDALHRECREFNDLVKAGRA